VPPELAALREQLQAAQVALSAGLVERKTEACARARMHRKRCIASHTLPASRNQR
jgi:hypothetical protein